MPSRYGSHSNNIQTVVQKKNPPPAFTVVFLQNYETDLASYTSGLETLLNVPIKRTMLRSPSMDLHEEVMKPKPREELSLIIHMKQCCI